MLTVRTRNSSLCSEGIHRLAPVLPDGKRIAFDSSRTGSFEIYIMAADGGNPVQLTRMGVESAAPRWSNDGKRIYFESVRTGRHEIWMIPTSGGEPVQITQNGGYAACESPDGAELYYTKVYEGGTLWRMRLTGGPETKAIDNVLFRNFAWGRRLYTTCGRRARTPTSSCEFLTLGVLQSSSVRRSRYRSVLRCHPTSGGLRTPNTTRAEAT